MIVFVIVIVIDSIVCDRSKKKEMHRTKRRHYYDTNVVSTRIVSDSCVSELTEGVRIIE